MLWTNLIIFLRQPVANVKGQLNLCPSLSLNEIFRFYMFTHMGFYLQQ